MTTAAAPAPRNVRRDTGKGRRKKSIRKRRKTRKGRRNESVSLPSQVRARARTEPLARPAFSSQNHTLWPRAEGPGRRGDTEAHSWCHPHDGPHPPSSEAVTPRGTVSSQVPALHGADSGRTGPPSPPPAGHCGLRLLESRGGRPTEPRRTLLQGCHLHSEASGLTLVCC